MTLSDLKILVERKRVKNINLRIYPPHGQIRVTAPLQVHIEVIRLFVLSKISWIEKNRQFYKNYTPPAADQYVTGEKHSLWGQKYILDVTTDFDFLGAQILNASHIHLNVSTQATKKEREKIFNDWCLSLLKEQIAIDMKKWQTLLNLKPIAWSVRSSKTRWGSYSLKTKRISLSFYLIEKSRPCLEYVILHELAHIFEPNHGPRFKKILDTHMPHWKKIQAELNPRKSLIDANNTLDIGL